MNITLHWYFNYVFWLFIWKFVFFVMTNILSPQCGPVRQLEKKISCVRNFLFRCNSNIIVLNLNIVTKFIHVKQKYLRQIKTIITHANSSLYMTAYSWTYWMKATHTHTHTWPIHKHRKSLYITCTKGNIVLCLNLSNTTSELSNFWLPPFYMKNSHFILKNGSFTGKCKWTHLRPIIKHWFHHNFMYSCYV